MTIEYIVSLLLCRKKVYPPTVIKTRKNKIGTATVIMTSVITAIRIAGVLTKTNVMKYPSLIRITMIALMIAIWS